jgi:hypothetical protein
VFIFISLLTLSAHADWLCKEASSTRSEHIITTCGVGSSNTLEEARSKSRESAIEEFKRLCQLSDDCRENDYRVTPMRTDCELKDGSQTCYRALEFQILNGKRKDVHLDLNDLESEVQEKNREINDLEVKIDRVKALKNAEAESQAKNAELKELESKLNEEEAKTLKLEDLASKDTVAAGEYTYFHQTYRSSVKVSLKYWNGNLSSEKESDLVIDLAYEKRPASWLGIQPHIGLGIGLLKNTASNQSEVQFDTSRNPKSVNQSMNFADLGIAGLIYPGWKSVYLKGEAGFIKGSRRYFSVSYPPASVGVITPTSESISKGYIGVSVGFDTRSEKSHAGVYFEVGTRKVSDDNTLRVVGSLGLNAGF